MIPLPSLRDITARLRSLHAGGGGEYVCLAHIGDQVSDDWCVMSIGALESIDVCDADVVVYASYGREYIPGTPGRAFDAVAAARRLLSDAHRARTAARHESEQHVAPARRDLP